MTIDDATEKAFAEWQKLRAEADRQAHRLGAVVHEYVRGQYAKFAELAKESERYDAAVKERDAAERVYRSGGRTP